MGHKAYEFGPRLWYYLHDCYGVLPLVGYIRLMGLDLAHANRAVEHSCMRAPRHTLLAEEELWSNAFALAV